MFELAHKLFNTLGYIIAIAFFSLDLKVLVVFLVEKNTQK